jgi:hypothetical protein
MPMVHIRGTILTEIPAPSDTMLGFTRSGRGRSTFRQCLESYCEGHNIGDQTKVILQACQKLNAGFKNWEDRGSPKLDLDIDVEYQDALHEDYDRVALRNESHSIALVDDLLLSAHIRFAMFREDGETSLSASRSPDLDSEVRGYFEAWTNISKVLLTEGKGWKPNGFEPLTPEALETWYFDAWVTMLFRGCLGGACHKFVPGERVPSE